MQDILHGVIFRWGREVGLGKVKFCGHGCSLEGSIRVRDRRALTRGGVGIRARRPCPYEDPQSLGNIKTG
jgi:hypothetical protein